MPWGKHPFSRSPDQASSPTTTQDTNPKISRMEEISGLCSSDGRGMGAWPKSNTSALSGDFPPVYSITVVSPKKQDISPHEFMWTNSNKLDNANRNIPVHITPRDNRLGHGHHSSQGSNAFNLKNVRQEPIAHTLNCNCPVS